MENMIERMGKIKEKIFKYGIKIVIMIAILLFTIGCSRKEDVDDSYVKRNELLDEKEAIEYFEDNEMRDVSIPLEKDFYDIIADNPIDQQFVWSGSSSVERIALACKYRDAWEAEIENTMLHLKDYLSEEDYTVLNVSYQGWRQYIQNVTEVEQALFYIGSDYKRADTNIITGDNSTYPRVMESVAIRTKNYAVQLMAMEYALTGKVEFLLTD